MMTATGDTSRSCTSPCEPRALARAESTQAEARGSLGLSHDLPVINHELADLLGVAPVSLTLGAELALADELVVCGILGGKDVGKSTLINALAQSEVSVDPVEVGKGTERPMAYVHEDAQPVIAQRLRDLDRVGSIDVALHKADAIRNVVLVDLPDFDSEFQDHLGIVRAIAPPLDRLLWVVTPRKIGDRLWVEMFQSVIKDPRNVHCVLNKLDELLADAEPFEQADHRKPEDDHRRSRGFWEEQARWVARSIEAAGCPHTQEHRFLLAAAFDTPDRFVRRIGELWDDPTWSEHAADRGMVEEIAKLACDDLSRLRSSVLAAVSPQQTCDIKEANQTREQQVNIARLRRHFELDRTIERLVHACDPQYYQQVLTEAMGPEYSTAIAAALQTHLRPDTELADELLERRVEPWPLLRLVHWPFGWLSRILGRRVSPASRAPVKETADPFDVQGRCLLERIDLMRARIVADHSLIIRRLGIESQLPPARALADRVAAAVRTLPPTLEERLLDEIRSRDRRPSFLGKAALWLVLLWFPFLQPLLAGGLEMFAQTGSFNVAHGLYRIVSAFSAVHLLTGFAVVAAVYVALLAGMYARALRAIRKLRAEQGGTSPLTTALDETFINNVVVPLATPFQESLERLANLQTRLDDFGAQSNGQ